MFKSLQKWSQFLWFCKGLPWVVSLGLMLPIHGMGEISPFDIPEVNPDLKPMRVTEKEIGLEMQLFDEFLGVDVTYYEKVFSDQILSQQISDRSGYLNLLINVGESENKGVEMLVNIAPFRNQAFIWNTSFNAAYNETKGLYLGEDVSDDMITVGNAEFHGELRQEGNKPMAQLYGWGYLRDEQGRMGYDPNKGRFIRLKGQLNFGSALPKWVGVLPKALLTKVLPFLH